MSKEEILTGYLNVVEFTDRVFGVGAAAHAYFGTTPDKLTVPQSAMLAGMVVFDLYQRLLSGCRR